MRSKLFSLTVVFLVTCVAAARAGTGCTCGDASCGGCKSPGQCVLVPETKSVKKVIYEIKCVPYCDHAPPSCLHGRNWTECDLCGKSKDGNGHTVSAGSHCCPQCRAQPKYKKVLVKREIEVGKACNVKCAPEGMHEFKPGCGCKGDDPAKAESEKQPPTDGDNQAPVPSPPPVALAPQPRL